MRLMATIEQRELTELILRHLDLPADLPAPWSARAPPMREEASDCGVEMPGYETCA